MKFIYNLAVNILALFVIEYVLPGFVVKDLWTAVVASIFIGIINTFVKPVLQIIALPISVITLGLFAFFLNVLLFYLVSIIVPGFKIESLWTAAIASIILSFISWFFHRIK